TEDGERMRRYQQANARTLFRAIGTLFRVRKEADRDPGDDPARPSAPGGDEAPAPSPTIAVECPIGAGDETNPIAEATGAGDETTPIAEVASLAEAGIPTIAPLESRLTATDTATIPSEAANSTPAPQDPRLPEESSPDRVPARAGTPTTDPPESPVQGGISPDRMPAKQTHRGSGLPGRPVQPDDGSSCDGSATSRLSGPGDPHPPR